MLARAPGNIPNALSAYHFEVAPASPFYQSRERNPPGRDSLCPTAQDSAGEDREHFYWCIFYLASSFWWRARPCLMLLPAIWSARTLLLSGISAKCWYTRSIDTFILIALCKYSSIFNACWCRHAHFYVISLWNFAVDIEIELGD